MTSAEIIKLARARQVIGADARRIRTSAGLSLAEVAKPVGVSAVTVSRWETGQRSPHGRPALRYLRLLDDLAEVAA